MDIGDDLPDKSGDSSDERSLEWASSSPVAFVFDEPTAGAAFCPSLPIWSMVNGRKVAELAVDRTDSVGLPGRSKVAEGAGRPEILSRRDEEIGAAAVAGDKMFAVFVVLRGLWLAVSEDVEALMVASLRRRSSNGAAVPPTVL